MKFLKSYNLQHAVSVSVAVIVSIFVNYFFSFSNTGWIVLTAFLIGQTTRGTPLRQSYVLLITIIAVIIITDFLLKHVDNIFADCILACIFIFSSSIAFLNRPLANETYYSIIFFSLILLIAILIPENPQSILQFKIIDVLVGALIGILSGSLIFPVKVMKEFRHGVIPVLDELIAYSEELVKSFKNHDQHFLTKKKLEMNIALETQSGAYPKWVYEPGFNPGLRSGFRFFLIHLERLMEIFFSLNYWTHYSTQNEMVNLSVAMSDSMQKNVELLKILKNFFTNSALVTTKSDYTSDMTKLEDTLRTIVPGNLELLDISFDYVMLTACVRDIKDMRQILLQLVMALPISIYSPK